MKKKISEQLIRDSSVLVLRFAIQSLIRVAMLEATRIGPLRDLKEWVNLNHICDLDIQLLDALEIPKFDFIIETIERIDEAIDRYKNLYHINEETCGTCEKTVQFAQWFFNPFSWTEAGKFQGWETAQTYMNILALIDSVIELTAQGKFENNNRNALYEFENGYYERKGNFPVGSDLQGASGIWYNLFREIEKGFVRIQRFNS